MGLMPKHPAKYSKNILPILRACVGHVGSDVCVLDPMGGVNGISGITRQGITTFANELEFEWASENPTRMVCGDALRLPFRDGAFDAVVVSPTYGNRMADHHEAQDGSERNTYRHKLGRPLSASNSGQLQWGAYYRMFHETAWQESLRVLSPKARSRFIINTSNHIRKGEEIDVNGWHHQLLESLGLRRVEYYEVRTQRNRQGANGNLRVPFEVVASYKRV